METVLIIGGGGFMGSRIARLLATRGAKVVSMDVGIGSPMPDSPTSIKVVKADITQFDELIAVMNEYKPTRVINLSYMLGSNHIPHAAMKLNILGMDNCFEAARMCGVNRVVFASSIAVNGLQKHYGERLITEDDVPYCESQYGRHKIFNEWQAQDYQEKHGLSIVAIRAAMVTGPDKVRGSVDHVNCMAKPARGEPVVLPYRDPIRCLIHVDDVAEIFARVTLADAVKHSIYNTGGAAISLGDLADIVRGYIPSADIKFEHEFGGLDTAMNYLVDNSRVIDEFGIRFPPIADRVLQIVNDARKLHNAPPL